MKLLLCHMRYRRSLTNTSIKVVVLSASCVVGVNNKKQRAGYYYQQQYYRTEVVVCKLVATIVQVQLFLSTTTRALLYIYIYNIHIYCYWLGVGQVKSPSTYGYRVGTWVSGHVGSNCLRGWVGGCSPIYSTDVAGQGEVSGQFYLCR